MVTTVGTESSLEDLLEDLIQLDHDAVHAYEAAIDRLHYAGFREALKGFCQDHLRHIEELGAQLSALGREPPKEGDMKSVLAKGKVVVFGLVGDTAILQAMKTNEDDTNTAYERAAKHDEASEEVRDALSRGLADERRHRDWMVETIKKL
ncbi:MAG TPA: DUF2383 domain-containing protein [Stellaceae bacterium]|nr:DUF2383 domain-containing protein [Stellaceae bacterium]